MIMFGTNPKRPIVKGNGDILYIQEIFATLQGEGKYTGHPAIFLRLGGCNLACSFCDTEFENFSPYSLAKISQQILSLAGNSIKLIVITGGEPFRQPIELLVTKLLELGFKVQIESNGTLYRPVPKDTEIICSPKIVQNKYSSIRPELFPHLIGIKFLISASLAGYKQPVELGQTMYNIPTYLQPMDEYNIEKNTANLQLAIKLAMEYNYILSLQTHKLIGLP